MISRTVLAFSACVTHTREDRIGIERVKGEELDDVGTARFVEPSLEHLVSPADLDQRVPLLVGGVGAVELKQDVDVHHACDVLRPLDVAAHPVDRFSDAAQHVEVSEIREHPGVLASPTLRRVHDKRSLPQSNTGQAAGQDIDLAAIENIRPQVDVSSFETVLYTGRYPRERQRRLGDVVSRRPRDPFCKLPPLFCGRMWSYQHAVAA